MQDDRHVPSWTRRRLQRHLARRDGARVVRWMCFSAQGDAREAAQPARPAADNVVTLRPRSAACG